jgi:hypothetical protein
VYSDTLPILKLGYLAFCFRTGEVPCIPWILTPYQMYGLKIFHRLIFCCAVSFVFCAEAFSLIELRFIHSLVAYASIGIYRNFFHD